jgi:hypothetical protein
VFIGKVTENSIASIADDADALIKSKLIFDIGKTTILYNSKPAIRDQQQSEIQPDLFWDPSALESNRLPSFFFYDNS